MADAVTTQTLHSSSKKTIRVFTNVSDGTGESAVNKFNISDLVGAPTKVKINSVGWACDGLSVRILFDHTTDDTVLVLSGNGFLDFDKVGGLHDPASSGGTGDILFTTLNHSLDDSYTIYMEVESS